MPKNIPRIPWTTAEQGILFSAFEEYGCAWSKIAKLIPAHSDTQIKNKFYSTIRKGLRRFNDFILHIKKKEDKNLKPVQEMLIRKLMAVGDRQYEKKLEVRQKAVSLVFSIINDLLRLSEKQRDYVLFTQGNGFVEENNLLEEIKQFRRNCRMKRGYVKNPGPDITFEKKKTKNKKIQRPQNIFEDAVEVDVKVQAESSKKSSSISQQDQEMRQQGIQLKQEEDYGKYRSNAQQADLMRFQQQNNFPSFRPIPQIFYPGEYYPFENYIRDNRFTVPQCIFQNIPNTTIQSNNYYPNFAYSLSGSAINDKYQNLNLNQQQKTDYPTNLSKNSKPNQQFNAQSSIEPLAFKECSESMKKLHQEHASEILNQPRNNMETIGSSFARYKIENEIIKQDK